MVELNELVAEAARAKLNLAEAKLRDEHFYASLPLCIIDAVFSIGVKYEGTKRTVIRWAEAQHPPWPLDRRNTASEHTVSEFIQTMSALSAEELATGPFGNKQRTSSNNGILKAEAVRRFAMALQKAGIDQFADVRDVAKLELAEALVQTIPGQKSGISFDYFALLAGNELVKADRMICRFVADAAGLATVSPKIAKEAVIGAAAILKREFPDIDTRLLDSEVWLYESAKAAQRNRSRLSSE